MKLDGFTQLFQELEKVTHVKDIAYHAIGNGRLNPVCKTHTDILGMEKWKKTHAQNPVYIKETRILQKIIETKSAIAVQDTKKDPISSDAFFLFGIDSILVIPVIKKETVIGIICIASIAQHHHFSPEEIQQCESLVQAHTSKMELSESIEEKIG